MELEHFPFPEGPFSTPSQEYERRRREQPFGEVLTLGGHLAILLVRADDVRAALSDSRLLHNMTAPDSPRLHPAGSFRQDPRLIINMDREEHLRLRRIVAATFTPKNIARWHPVIVRIAEELCDTLVAAGPPADLVAGYCFQLPVLVICRLLGVPEPDAPRFRDWSAAFLSATRLTPGEREQAVSAFSDYVDELISARRAAPGDALIDELIAARDGQDRLSESELHMLVLGLIAVGNEATSNSLSRAALTLLRDDGRLWHLLRAAPESLGSAISELLRISPPGSMLSMRLAAEDVDLPSGTVRAGQPVVIATGAALRDPDLFPCPATVRFERDASAEFVFGGGPHFCLGVHLAKEELRVGLTTLMARLPRLRLALAETDVEFTGGDILSSLAALPVSW